MPNETGTQKTIPKLYSEGMREVNRVVAQGNAAQRELALQTLDDLTAMMLAHTLEKVQGRTALLTGLIAELTQVIDSVKVQPPYADAIEGLTKVVDGARKRLATEKEKLLPPEA